MTRAFFLLALLLAPAPLAAEAAVTSYESCLARVQEDPEGAYDAALNWRDFGGGGAGAKHCAALALVASGQYGEAARQLEALAASPDAGDRYARAEILAQEGNAWLLQGKPTLAYNTFTRGLELTPTDSQTLIDRARALMLLGRHADAEKDLGTAIDANPTATEAFVLRASARRERGDIKGANEDANEAVRLEPKSAEALLERGLVRQALNDRQGALADWHAALAADTESPAGKEAQRLLEEAALGTDVKSSGNPPANKATP
jgi:tetratricopeptide (TPR) repeat protein